MIILKHTFPVCWVSDTDLLIYKLGTFYRYDIVKNKRQKIVSFPFSFKQDILARIPLIARILRLGVRYGIKRNDKSFIVVRDKTFYEIDIIANRLSKKSVLERGSRPLNIAAIRGINGFDNGLYYGEYFGNPQCIPVSVMRMDEKEKPQPVYTFAQGEINHIHALVPDKDNQFVWILTGDFDNSAGIWIAKNNFKEVYPVFQGTQKSRSCVAFPVEGGLLYATDTPFEKNAICFLYRENNEWKVRTLRYISGSCIYGCKWNNRYVFSTAVESNGHGTSFFESILTRKKGDGIEDYQMHLYIGTISAGFEEIYSTKKDFMPFVLGQFGSLSFPTGQASQNVLPVYHIASKKDDLCTLLLNC